VQEQAKVAAMTVMYTLLFLIVVIGIYQLYLLVKKVPDTCRRLGAQGKALFGQ
jgi:hypothetical protein